jgi:4-hydroxy-2-oxoheptanedioate aldolase
VEISPLEKLAQSLANKTPLLSSWLAFSDPLVALYMASEAVDAVTFDVQHGQQAFNDVIVGIGNVALAGKPSIVRVPVGDYQMASRFLDAGASAIIAPMVNSAADAKRFVEFTKYPPVGGRSWGPFLACTVQKRDTVTYLQQANRICYSIPMIETLEGLANVDQILSIEGIDGVFVGPGDLSLSMSKGANVDPLNAEVQKAADHVLSRCRHHGKSAWIMGVSPENCGDLVRRGFDLVALGMEVFHIQQGTRNWIDAARGQAPAAAEVVYK